jgi:radical SAM enzyme (TIGR01210 family)
MCGYVSDTCMREVTPAEIADQVEHVMARIPRSKGPFGLKIFTSGSFFDERELSLESRQHMLDELGRLEGLAELTVESRPEHIDKEAVSMLQDRVPNAEVEVAVGLESSSDRVRGKCIGKGFTFRQFERACKCIRSKGARSKAYVLLKPPFLSEFDACYDAVRTVEGVSGIVDSVSLNACNVQKGTLVEELFRAGAYRPSWIWTVMEVLRQAKQGFDGERNVICDTVAFGTPRGPHNCRKCDDRATGMVRRFSLSQDASALEGLECHCRSGWAKIYNYHF